MLENIFRTGQTFLDVSEEIFNWFFSTMKIGDFEFSVAYIALGAGFTIWAGYVIVKFIIDIIP